MGATPLDSLSFPLASVHAAEHVTNTFDSELASAVGFDPPAIGLRRENHHYPLCE